MRSKPNDRRKILGRTLLLGTAALLSLVLGWNVLSMAATGLGRIFDSARPAEHPHVTLRRMYTVRVGDTVNGIASRFGIPVSTLIAANHLANPNNIRIGQRLFVPYTYHPRLTESLIRREARRQHLDPNFAVGVAYQESGFKEYVTSHTGAIGVMQVEPGTGQLVATDTGRSYNLGVETDNIAVGVYLLAYLVRYYGGNERNAAAAYYEGQGNLAKYGYLTGTKAYVDNVMALRAQFTPHSR